MRARPTAVTVAFLVCAVSAICCSVLCFVLVNSLCVRALRPAKPLALMCASDKCCSLAHIIHSCRALRIRGSRLFRFPRVFRFRLHGTEKPVSVVGASVCCALRFFLLLAIRPPFSRAHKSRQSYVPLHCCCMCRLLSHLPCGLCYTSGEPLCARAHIENAPAKTRQGRQIKSTANCEPCNNC